MSNAKLVVIFLKCIGCLLASEIIRTSSITFHNETGHTVISCAIRFNNYTGKEPKRIKKAFSTTVEIQSFPSVTESVHQP